MCERKLDRPAILTLSFLHVLDVLTPITRLLSCQQAGKISGFTFKKQVQDEDEDAHPMLV